MHTYLQPLSRKSAQKTDSIMSFYNPSFAVKLTHESSNFNLWVKLFFFVAQLCGWRLRSLAH
ncbi:protein of unknown function [Candidatus Filomicrobium marinum]|uniref:Uncharacterized protein n=1 Tax=Candidatus Filomicrobium marinum TaxID=1608628 RepID=A0A0D6JDN3_9HYPH|nr:protein of unknown function [Candidatus Filomicrobium marinum]CPR18109.1 protein of unknown function [Candidatus Filomicrobium marinum]